MKTVNAETSVVIAVRDRIAQMHALASNKAGSCEFESGVAYGMLLALQSINEMIFDCMLRGEFGHEVLVEMGTISPEEARKSVAAF